MEQSKEIEEYVDICEQLLGFEISDDLLERNSKNGSRNDRATSKTKSDKRVERYKRVVQYRQVRRRDERKRHRSRKVDLPVVQHELDFPLQIYVDFKFPYLMNFKELRRTVNQVGRIWGLYKKYIGLNVTLLAPNEAFLHESRCILSGFDRFSWYVSSQTLEDCVSDRCVYLSPDADLPPLTDVRGDNIYIIGGLVDETGAGSLSKMRADSLEIPAYRLPIVDYMQKGPKGTFNVMLSLNNVVEILALYTVLKDWKEVFSVALPKRIGYSAKD